MLVRLSFAFALLPLLSVVRAGNILYDGRASYKLKAADLDSSNDPYLTGVKGTEAASHYTTLLGKAVPPTPLWNSPWGPRPLEQAVSVTIDNSSVFYPGGKNPQWGFRRTELIAQKDKDHNALNQLLEVGTTVFHFSIKVDPRKPLNYKHEYQPVFIEPTDGSHVFGIQIGSPFTNPTASHLPTKGAYNIKVLDRALNVLFSAPFTPGPWHNFAVQVDWDNLTLGVFYSEDGAPLRPATPRAVPNQSAQKGPGGQGDFHFGLLKLPLVNPADSLEDQNDVVHRGLQEGTLEGLFYSGIFVEDVKGGVQVALGKVVRPLKA